MRYCPEYCIEMPDDFPVEALTIFMANARQLLLQPRKQPEWTEFAGASNLIGWRYRASSEAWDFYRESWQTKGVAVDHEEGYRRERALFGMFTAGVACIESTTYALAALASHKDVFSISFEETEQRSCSPKKLHKWLSTIPNAFALSATLSIICSSAEWKLWVDLRNRMTHRSNLPRMNLGALGGELPPPKALHFAATSSSPAVEGDLALFDALHNWLTRSLASLLVDGSNLPPK